MEQQRGGFATNFGFLMAAIGSAVGFGNIWGFPYKMGANGGFAFLLVYLFLAVFVGFCTMVGELAIGRKTGKSAVGAYRAMSKSTTFVGVIAVIAAFFILCFYLVLGGYVMRYVFGYLLAIFGVDTFGDPAEFFGNFLMNGGSVALWFAIFAILNIIIVAGGVEGGIEKFNKYAMPALFFLLLIMLIYVACQPNSGEGYKFIFGFNTEPLKENFVGVLGTAAGQMFFSLSLGFTAILTYGSYLSKSADLQKDAVIIVVMDTLVAILAGMVVLPACSAYGLEFGSGPGLLFTTMQVVFSRMGGIGNLMGFLFYFLVFLAGISSSISVIEGIVSVFVDRHIEQAAEKAEPLKERKKWTIIWVCIIFVCGLPVALDALGGGHAAGAVMGTPAEVFGSASVKAWNDCWLDFFDMLSEGVGMPLSAFFMCMFIGWKWGPETIFEEIEQDGKPAWGKGFLTACYKVITPIGLLFVLYGQISGFFS